MMKVRLGRTMSICCAFAFLFCVSQLFLPNSAVGATYTSTVKITVPNTVLSGDTILIRRNYEDGLEAKIKNAGELNNVKISTFGSSGWGVISSVIGACPAP